MNINNIQRRQQKHRLLWSENAAVIEHREILKKLEIMEYQYDYDDFVKEYLPFYSDEYWSILTKEKQKLFLSFGWFMYNLKTIIIEQSALTEYCKIILSGQSSFSFTRDFIHRIAQVQVDETYHTLMSYKGIELCSRLADYNLDFFPDTDLATYIFSLNTLPPQDKELAWLALTTVCEATISKYLAILPNEKNVQPAFRFITDMHRQDEASHSSLFIDLMVVAKNELDDIIYQKLIGFIKKSVEILMSPDKNSWDHLHALVGVVPPDFVNPQYKNLYSFRSIEKFM
ncbi:diiron oxygenase [Erwinia mallotivora]|uniref:diiron oxygenase n=1 Tax=Erwinia mallotivora TaxID=69222 RepID=UPI0035E8BBFB